ncbi:MAG: carbon-nitrogen hydrolase family protein [Bacteriovoracaceae bacterium]|nr:carbon-nitrogen hydrolase family protein [Bacteriovoracaceae bacterium]
MKLKIASAQYPITYFKSLTEWKEHTQRWIDEACNEQAEVLLFPEYGSMELTSLLSTDEQASLEKQLSGLQQFVQPFKELYQKAAQEKNVLIIAPSFPLKVENLHINRAFIFFPDGNIEYQDKQMMTRFENEEWFISTGEKNLKVFTYNNIQFGINICYDGEFPNFAQEQSINGMQVLLHPSCTEGKTGMERVHVGARARALENQIYVVVSQTIGDAPWSIAVDRNTGTAAFYSTCDHLFPSDGILLKGKTNEAGWLYQTLDISLIEEIRKTGQVFNYQDMLQIYKK